MRRFIEIIKQKWLKQRVTTFLLVFIIAMIFIFLNIFAQKINVAPLDFTSGKLYSLSDESKEQIAKVEQNVNMYYFGYTESDTAYILGKQYNSINSKIKLTIIDANERPDLASEYGYSSSSYALIAVEGPDDRYKVINSEDFYTYDDEYNIYDLTEQKLTNAILDVTIQSKPYVYFLTGHGEFDNSKSGYLYQLGLEIENDINNVGTLDLLSTNVPEKCDLIIIANPVKDFSNSEVEKLKAYINNGGNIMWMQNPYKLNSTGAATASDLPNVQSILDMYGIKFSDGLVLETDEEYYADSQALILPLINYHQIVKDFSTTGSVLMYCAGKIETNEDMVESGEITNSILLKSTDTSVYMEDFENDEAADTDGEYVLGEVITRNNEEGKSSTLVAYSNVCYCSDLYSLITERYNKDLALNTVAYLTDREDSINIRKNSDIYTFSEVSTAQSRRVLFVIFAIPVAIILAGIVIPIIRRIRR